MESKELSLWHKLEFSNPFAKYWRKPLGISNFDNLILENSQLEISKIYDIGSQRYWDLKIRVCGKDSIPLQDQLKNTEQIVCRFLALF